MGQSYCELAATLSLCLAVNLCCRTTDPGMTHEICCSRSKNGFSMPPRRALSSLAGVKAEEIPWLKAFLTASSSWAAGRLIHPRVAVVLARTLTCQSDHPGMPTLFLHLTTEGHVPLMTRFGILSSKAGLTALMRDPHVRYRESHGLKLDSNLHSSRSHKSTISH